MLRMRNRKRNTSPSAIARVHRVSCACFLFATVRRKGWAIGVLRVALHEHRYVCMCVYGDGNRAGVALFLFVFLVVVVRCAASSVTVASAVVPIVARWRVGGTPTPMGIGAQRTAIRRVTIRVIVRMSMSDRLLLPVVRGQWEMCVWQGKRQRQWRWRARERACGRGDGTGTNAHGHGMERSGMARLSGFSATWRKWVCVSVRANGTGSYTILCACSTNSRSGSSSGLALVTSIGLHDRRYADVVSTVSMSILPYKMTHIGVLSSGARVVPCVSSVVGSSAGRVECVECTHRTRRANQLRGRSRLEKKRAGDDDVDVVIFLNDHDCGCCAGACRHASISEPHATCPVMIRGLRACPVST